MTIQMGGGAGYAFPPMIGAELKRTVIPGTLSLAHLKENLAALEIELTESEFESLR